MTIDLSTKINAIVIINYYYCVFVEKCKTIGFNVNNVIYYYTWILWYRYLVHIQTVLSLRSITAYVHVRVRWHSSKYYFSVRL